MACPRCVPHWEVSQAAKHLPPWTNVFTRPGVRVACPACRSALTTVWHGGDGIPFTEGYGRRSDVAACFSKRITIASSGALGRESVRNRP